MNIAHVRNQLITLERLTYTSLSTSYYPPWVPYEDSVDSLAVSLANIENTEKRTQNKKCVCPAPSTLQVSLLGEAFPKVGWVKEVMIGTMDVKSGCFEDALDSREVM
eukprot:scaffold5466_cov175-Skeletonema_marinoi.AAC.5